MPRWIQDPTELLARFDTPPARIGLDTEFIRERTYWPQLALVQIAIETGDGLDILLVDPLVPGMTEALATLLADTRILKVMHSPSEDLVAFKHACNTVPRPLFDTQLAAALAGIAGGMGYQRLVESMTGVALAKGETRSDWMRRPLSPSQLEYAADDVRHLFELHDALDADLNRLGRRAWLAEDAERTLANADSDDVERWPHLSLRSAQFLDLGAQRRLVRLLRWRDRYARDNDRPRTWILDNELATAIAR
ncbi:MAG: ribonuclease D, partial [Lysobacterales bacterium RIFOXYD1_FULL_69_11]